MNTGTSTTNPAPTKKRRSSRRGPTRYQTRSKGSGPVYELRTALGLTQQELADKAGVFVTTIGKCERAGRKPSDLTTAYEKLERFAQAQGIAEYCRID